MEEKDAVLKAEDRENYGKTVRLSRGRKISCYSARQMRGIYPKGNYRIVAEAGPPPHADAIRGTLEVQHVQMPLTAAGAHPRWLYRRVGYVAVDDEKHTFYHWI